MLSLSLRSFIFWKHFMLYSLCFSAALTCSATHHVPTKHFVYNFSIITPYLLAQINQKQVTCPANPEYYLNPGKSLSLKKQPQNQYRTQINGLQLHTQSLYDHKDDATTFSFCDRGLKAFSKHSLLDHNLSKFYANYAS